MAAKMWPEVKDIRKPWWGFVGLFWVSLLALFTWNVLSFGAVGKSLHAKSPMFRSHYTLVPGTLDLQGAGLREILSGEANVGFSVDVEIQNPTATDLELENNRLEIWHGQDLVATTRLNPVTVSAGTEQIQNVGLDLNLDLSMVTKGLGLLDTDQWSLTLFIEVKPGLEFPLYLKAN
jgi:hypothetical protein